MAKSDEYRLLAEEQFSRSGLTEEVVRLLHLSAKHAELEGAPRPMIKLNGHKPQQITDFARELKYNSR